MKTKLERRKSRRKTQEMEINERERSVSPPHPAKDERDLNRPKDCEHLREYKYNPYGDDLR